MALGRPGARLSERRPREPLPDALRALALIGVLVVNGLSYQDGPYGRLLGQARPADSAWTQGLMTMVAAFVQGKAYPVLALLFGMGMAYAARGLSAVAAIRGAQRRAGRLLIIGVLHGTLLYYGDILTSYALCALWITPQVREPWTLLRPRLRRALGWALAAVAASAALALMPMIDDGPRINHATIGTVSGYAAFVSLNANTYAIAQFYGLMLTLPLVRLTMLAGIAAVRLRCLTHRRWRHQLDRLLRRWGWPVVIANLAFAVAYVGLPSSVLALALQSSSPLWATPLAMLYVAVAARAWRDGARGWAMRLAILGQHTLSVYVGASLLMVVLFSGAGLGWQLSTAGWLLLALGVWSLAWAASALWRGRWPLEAWMVRR